MTRRKPKKPTGTKPRRASGKGEPVAYRRGGGASSPAADVDKAAPASSLPSTTLRNPRPGETVGTGGTAIYGGVVRTTETNPKLIGSQKWRTFDKMTANCTTVSASLLFFLGLGSKVTWSWSPADESPEALDIHEKWMKIVAETGVSWRGFVRGSLMAPWRGFSLFEMTAYRRADGLIGVRLSLRPQKTIEKWVPGDDGEIAWVVQRSPQDQSERAIPRWKLLYNVADAITDSPEGLGILRMLVKAVDELLDFEHNEGIGIVSNMGGVPKVFAPLDAIDKDPLLTDAAKNQRKQPFRDIISKHVRAVDQGYLLDSITYSDAEGKPSNVRMYDIDILRGDPAAMGPVHTAITRKKHEIASVCGTEFLLVGSDGAGSLALSEAKLSATVEMVNGELEDVVEMVNGYYRAFVAARNGWPVDKCPKASVEKLSMKNAAEVAASMRDWYTARAQMPAGDPATDVFRRHLGFPPEPEVEVDDEADAGMRGKVDIDDNDLEDDEDDEDGKEPKAVKKGECPVITVASAARRFGVDRRSLEAAVEGGLLVKYISGSLVRVDPNEVLALLPSLQPNTKRSPTPRRKR